MECSSSRASHTRANSQPRRTVRGAISRAAIGRSGSRFTFAARLGSRLPPASEYGASSVPPSQELTPLPPFDFAHIHHLQIRLMDRRRGWQRIPTPLVLDKPVRHQMQSPYTRSARRCSPVRSPLHRARNSLVTCAGSAQSCPVLWAYKKVTTLMAGFDGRFHRYRREVEIAFQTNRDFQ